MKKTFIFVAMSVICLMAQAARVKPGVFKVRLADGTEVLAQGYGDEYFHCYKTLEGIMLVQKGDLFAVATAEAIDSIAACQRMAMQRREPLDCTPNGCFPHMGSPKAIVVLAEFADLPFKVSAKADIPERNDSLKAIFSDYLNAETRTNLTGRNYGSVRSYFKAMSFGKYTPQFDVYGVCTLPSGYKTYGSGDDNMNQLFTDVAGWLNNQDTDFSVYDADGDGYIDLLYVIYAGYSASMGGNSSDFIWPKSGYNPSTATVSGKKIGRYGVNNELYGSEGSEVNIEGIGLFCHEFGHCIGLPDMYAPSGNGQSIINQAPEYFSVMDAGEYTYGGYAPTAFTAWERERMGWMDIEELASPQYVTMAPLDDSDKTTAKAYRIRPSEGSKEYYILENVQNRDWNQKLFAHGMVAWHIEFDEATFKLGGRPNGVIGRPQYSILPADGMASPINLRGKEITYGMLADEQLDAINKPFYDKYNGQTFDTEMYKADCQGSVFPGNQNVTELTDKAILYSGGTLGKPITNIQEDSETGMVTFSFMGGSGIGEVSDLQQAQEQYDYNLSGMKVNANYKGITIRNGRKYIK